MLNICLASFPPSKLLAKYLRNYLRNNTVVNEAAEAARPVEDGSGTETVHQFYSGANENI